MQELTDLLSEATAAIEPGYFRLSVHGGLPVYRERVYCNELYHQMRKRWLGGCLPSCSLAKSTRRPIRC
ncbi:hypothetical protein [Bradyrhizobium pachyrhizi]|uniref:hypothetical protein n=1 Tax=Bradyrhizobium pachyrhizi TaxID=280333 RepID=UPI000ABDDA90|nr:hypothetical protein [Bradyrhizobium pachyrhizi]